MMNSLKTIALKCLVTGLSVFTLLTGCSSKKKAALADVDEGFLYQSGKETYQLNCSLCHGGGDGTAMGPNLRQSVIVSAPDPQQLIKTILKGQKGISTVNGKKFTNAMPPFAHLNDRDVAAICTYIRKEFSRLESPTVQPSQVQALRD